MWSGPIGSRLWSGSSVCPTCESTSMIGISTAAVAAPGPSRRTSSSSLFISHRLRDSVRADESEMNVHQKHDQRREHEHMDREEALQRRRPDHGAALEDVL